MKISALDKLSPKRQRFVREYCGDLNGTQAAIRAGYAKKAAKQQASSLLTIPDVRAAVAEIQAAAAKRSDISLDWIVEKLRGNYELALSGNPVLDRYGKPTGEHMRQISAANQALSLMGEFLGYKLDRKAVVTLDITKMTESELMEAEAKLEALIEQGKAPKNGRTVH